MTEVSNQKNNAYWVPIALTVLLLFHVWVNIWWLHTDNHTIRTDEEGHMHMARNYYEAMFLGDVSMLQRLVDVSNIPPGNPAHPPLLHILGACMIALFGYSVDILAFTNTLLFVLTLLGCYAIARHLLPPPMALFATAVVSFTPIIYTASRFFMTDYLSLAIVVWAIYALLQSEQFRNTPWVFIFALLNGLGILTRTTTFLYYFIPAAMIFAMGVYCVWKQRNQGPSKVVLKKLLLNASLTIVVTVGIFSPWYFHHFDDFYYYWTKVHAGGRGGPVAFSGSWAPGTSNLSNNIIKGVETEKKKAPSQKPVQQQSKNENIQKKVPAKKNTPAPVKKKRTEKKSAQPKVNPQAPETLLGKLMHPRIPWSRYPLYVLNEGAFLLLFILGGLGLLLVGLRRTYRNQAGVTLVVWLLGSWVLMTVLLKYATPRYALQALPALSLGAALAVAAIPNRLMRRVVMGGVLAGLLFQFGNLSITPYGPLASMRLPGKHRPVIYKDTLHLGFSYTQLTSPERTNYKDRIFAALLQAENQRPDTGQQFANYVKVNVRGMTFDERHYWPEPNPYLRKDIPRDMIPKRRLRCIGLGATPQAVLDVLALADYVVYAVDENEKDHFTTWQAFFEERQYRLIDSFQGKPFGSVPRRYYAVMAAAPSGDVQTITSLEDIDRLNIYDLYEVQQLEGYQYLPNEFKSHIQQRFNTMIESFPPPHPLNHKIAFVNASAQPLKDDVMLFRFIFQINQAINQPQRVYFRGQVAEPDQKTLAPGVLEKGRLVWDFDPDPPANTWPSQGYVVIRHKIQTPTVPVSLFLDIYDPEKEYTGNPAPLGEIRAK